MYNNTSRLPFGYRFNIHYNPSMQTHELRIMEDCAGSPNKTVYARISWVEAKSGESIPPSISFDDRENADPIQDLMNAIWDAGYRPSNDRAVDNEPILDAKDAHILDLRTILLHTLGVKE